MPSAADGPRGRRGFFYRLTHKLLARMGVDIERHHVKKGHRQAPKSEDPYLLLSLIHI